MLHNGIMKEKQILPSNWMNFARSISPGEIKTTPSDFIEQNGVYGGGLWVNESIRELKRILPHAANNVFFAKGRFGQYIIIFPDQNLVVVRTGHDSDDWAELDLFASRIGGCFGNLEEDPQVQFPPENAFEEHFSFSDMIYAIRSGLLASMIAKEFCSCRYVTKISIEECEAESHIPLFAFKLFHINDTNSRVEVTPSALDYLSIVGITQSAYALFDPLHPEEGCRLY
jgi:hypothetical protein